MLIGNQNYRADDLTPLSNPLGDVADIAAKLEKHGFEVRVHEDLANRTAMENTARNFVKEIEDNTKVTGERPEAVLVHYAGHGLEVDGKSYLIPTDAETQPIAIDRSFMSLADLVRIVEPSAEQHLFLIDACRNDLQHGAPGVVTDDASRAIGGGTMLVYATLPGERTTDGAGGARSVFADALIDNMDQFGESFHDVLRRIRQRVEDDSNGRQTISVEGSLP